MSKDRMDFYATLPPPFTSLRCLELLCTHPHFLTTPTFSISLSPSACTPSSSINCFNNSKVRHPLVCRSKKKKPSTLSPEGRCGTVAIGYLTTPTHCRHQLTPFHCLPPSYMTYIRFLFYITIDTL